MVRVTKMQSGVEKCRKVSFFAIFAKSWVALGSRKIAQKRPISIWPASGESWDNSLAGVSRFWMSRRPLRVPKSTPKSKWCWKHRSTVAVSRIFTPPLERKISRKVFGSWSCLCWSHIPSLVELGGLGGPPQPFECSLSVLGWWPPYAALWILGLLSLKSPYLGLEAIFFQSVKSCW